MKKDLIHEFKTMTERQRKDATILIGVLSAAVCTGVGLICGVKKRKIDALKEITIKSVEAGKPFDVKF